MRQHFALQNQTLPNTPGRFQPEWVVGIGRNRWLASPEYARQGSCLVIPSRPPPARAGNQVAKFSRNRWPLSAGIGGQLPPEYATRGLGLRIDDAGARQMGRRREARTAHRRGLAARSRKADHDGKGREPGRRRNATRARRAATSPTKQTRPARFMTAPLRARGACGHGGGSENRPRKPTDNAWARRACPRT